MDATDQAASAGANDALDDEFARFEQEISAAADQAEADSANAKLEDEFTRFERELHAPADNAAVPTATPVRPALGHLSAPPKPATQTPNTPAATTPLRPTTATQQHASSYAHAGAVVGAPTAYGSLPITPTQYDPFAAVGQYTQYPGGPAHTSGGYGQPAGPVVGPQVGPVHVQTPHTPFGFMMPRSVAVPGQTPAPQTAQEKAVAEAKKKKIIRTAAGQTWEDDSLADWDEADYRIFVGDLANDCTDDQLIRAFQKYPSFLKAKVVRDRRTQKPKGYGFVSLRDKDDFVRAMREMNGKYVGSRPLKLRKSAWKDRNMDFRQEKEKAKNAVGLVGK
eukprot:Opistho-2@60643